MESCLYAGAVRHRRYAPVAHEFRYRLALMYLDLEELAGLLRGSRLPTLDPLGIASFRREDHLGDKRVPLADAVREFIVSRGQRAPAGPIRLLTHLRYCGYVMNPVSFYFCYDDPAREPALIVAEVNNTPWGEQHCYLLEPRQFAGSGDRSNRVGKEFHVSPFMPMDLSYRWRASSPADSLRIALANYRGETPFFDVFLALRREELSRASFRRFLWRYPLMTWQVTAGIYSQAVRLWWKGCRFHPHPRRTASPHLAPATSHTI